MVSYSPRQHGIRSVHLVDTQQARHAPVSLPGRHHIGRGVVVLVADVADDLSLIRSSTVTIPAVPLHSVDDERGLQAVRPDLCHHRVTVERRRDCRHRQRQRGQARARTVLCAGNGEDLLDALCRSWRRSPSTIETRVTGPGSRSPSDRPRVVGVEGLDSRLRRHQLGGAFTELQGTVDERCCGGVQRTTARGVAHERCQFLAGACRPQLFSGLDADAAQDPVRVPL